MSGALKKRSKLLSLILRHAPEKAGLTLGEGGWVAVDDLLQGLQIMKAPMSRDQLEEVVSTNEKKRFTLSEDGTKIRAAQGHSVKIDMAYEPVEPPNILYHGTAQRTLPLIREGGLKPMSRQHVHLSADRETALKVGQRHGKPILLEVSAGELHGSGQAFYHAENGVWLTSEISPQFIQEVA